jgi:hypothetical protein
MKNIAIIGAGQIGSRHLQALSNLEGIVTIQLIDPSGKSLRTAHDRFYQVYQEDSKRIRLNCHNNIDDLSGQIDLAIVATCSDVRAGAIKELISKKTVRNLLLEKVLFQTIREYAEIDNLLKEKDIPTWVNCWMRGKDFYKKLKTSLNLDEKIQMKIEGSLWSLGSSSIHFIDLFAYLTGCDDFNFTECHLSEEIIDTKRPRFKEFSGCLTGKNSKGHTLTLCRDNENDPYRVRIINGPQNHEITDCIDHVVHKLYEGKNETIEKAEIPFQSQTTHHLVQQIIKNKSCDLPNYRDSMTLHLPLIKILIEHLQNITGETVEACPIT